MKVQSIHDRRVGAIGSILALALAALVFDARSAEACTCAGYTGPVSPPDAATGVPTNAVLLFDTALEPVTAVTLTAPDATDVTLMMELHGSLLIARPMSTLAPSSVYTVSATVAGTVQTTRFTTGAGADSTAPTFPGVTAIGPELMQFTTATGPGGQGCFACDVHYAADDRLSRIRFTFPDPPADAVVLGVEIHIQGETSALAEFGLAPGAFADRLIGFRGCGPLSPDLQDGVTYCARVTAYDAAGNSAGGAAEACAAPMACAAQLDGMCEPVDACLPVDPNPGSGSDQATGTQTGGCASSSGAGLVLVLLALAPVVRRARQKT